MDPVRTMWRITATYLEIVYSANLGPFPSKPSDPLDSVSTRRPAPARTMCLMTASPRALIAARYASGVKRGGQQGMAESDGQRSAGRFTIVVSRVRYVGGGLRSGQTWLEPDRPGEELVLPPLARAAAGRFSPAWEKIASRPLPTQPP